MRHEHGGRTDAVPHPAQQLLSYTHRFSARGRRARCRCGGTLARALLLPPRHAVRRLHRPAAEERQRLPLPGARQGGPIPPFVLGNRCCTAFWTAAWHCRPRRSCKCDSSLSVDTKKNPMFLVSASLDEVVMNRRVVEPEHWLTSRATSSWPVSFPPSPTRSQLTAKPACCTSAQVPVHRVIHHCEIVNCCSTFLSLVAI